MFDFKKQLKFSDGYEKLFLEMHNGQLTKSEDFAYDFLHEDGRKFELKTDSYDMKKTSNFFMERYSDITSKKPGGPWRAAADGVDVFVYWFPSNGTWYEFHDVKGLVAFLEEYTAKDYLVHIRNRGWTTGGYKVPRDLLCKFFKRRQHALPTSNT